MILSPDTVLIALIALALDAVIGWPDRLYHRIGHPVTWLGRLIATLDRRWNRGCHRVLRGALASLVVILAASLPALALTLLIEPARLAPLFLGVLAWPLVASRSLDDHVRAVAIPLGQGDIAAAGEKAALIVGRDLDDRPEPIARAALESLAENSSDGVVAPLLWAAIAGLPGIAAYKAINTLDSMIGHRTARHELFGRFAARMDDLVNLPAARLTGLLLAAATGSWRALRVMWRDAGKHRSPNAGWPESAMAGALGIRLSGPRSYGGQVTDDPWLNATGHDPQAADLTAGLALYRRAILYLAGLMVMILALMA